MEEEVDEKVKVLLREKQAELIRILEALASLENSKEWETLKELIFSKSLKMIENQLMTESLNQVIDSNKLYRLQGEWSWAKQYNDIPLFTSNLKKQLEEIKKRLK